MSQTFSAKSYIIPVKKALCLLLAAALIFSALVFAPPAVKAEAADGYLYGSSYKVKITLHVTDDADGWNSASCKIYARAFQGAGSESLVKEYDIKDSISYSGADWETEYDCGTSFPSKVLIYTDFGGGFTWREWAADTTVYVNGVNVRSQHIVSSSGCFSSSDNTATLTIDRSNYPYPVKINVLNHHENLSDLPDEENFNEFYEGDVTDRIYHDAAAGRVFINACDRYGVAWSGLNAIGSYADNTSNDSGDRCRYERNASAPDVSKGSIYLLSSNTDVDHKSTYTFTFNTGNDSHSQVTKEVSVYFYFKHKLTVKVKGSTAYTAEKFRGQWTDLDEVPLPAGYTFNGYDLEGSGSYDYDSNQYTFGTGDAVLTAALKANKYKIAFNGNGATSGAMNSTKTATYDTALQLPANQFSKTDELGNYKFLGWNTAPDGSGTSISNKGFAINLTTVPNELVTLYAQWGLVGWTLTLHYPDEMGFEDRTVAVSKNEGLNFFEPEPAIDVGNGQYHYTYTGASEALDDINENMTVNLYYEQTDHVFTEPSVVVPPACETYGESESHCLYCGYELDHSLILPTGHTFGEPEWNWSITESGADAVFTCERCGASETVYGESSYSDSDHTRAVTVSVSFNGRTYSDSKYHHLNYISYDLNGGSGSLPTSVVYDGDFELPGLHQSVYKPYANFEGWLIGGSLYQPGDIVEAGDFTAVAQWDIPWANIQLAINGGASSIHLSSDVVATSSDGPLTIPSGRTVTIDLNGYNIDRNLDEPAANGSVFRITGGTLTLTDSKGTGSVTGGNTTGNGGGINVESGRVYINSASISYNKAAGNGGGIYLSGSAENSVVHSSGTVSRNICGGNGSGIYASGAQNELYLDGSATVTENICSGSSQSSGGVYVENIPFKINSRLKIYGNYKADESRSNTVLAGNNQQITVWYPLESGALVYISGEPGRALVHDSNVDETPSFTPDVSNYASDSYDYIPALDNNKDIVFVSHNHTLGEPVWVWADDFSYAQAVFGCTACDYSETCTASVTQSSGNTHYIYTATVTFGGETFTDTARKAKGWNLFVSGVQVDGDNYTDVFGDGSVQYDVNSNTLTLTDAVIETATRPGDSENEFGIRYSVNRGTPFKVVLLGENTIVNSETEAHTLNVYGIACYNGSSGSYDSKPVFSGGGSLCITLDSGNLSGCTGIDCSASVITFDSCAVDINITGGGKAEALHCNNSVALENGADVSLSTGEGSETVSLYASSLDVENGSAITLISGSGAMSANCALSADTAALGARVNTAPEAENGFAWGGSTPLNNYKYISIPSAFTVVWVIGDEPAETDENVPGNTTPEYNGEIPVDYEDGGFVYYFDGWSPEIAPVTADITYTAVFTQKRIVDINVTFNGKVYDGTPVTASDFTVTAVNPEYQSLVDSADITAEFETEAVDPGDYTATFTVSGNDIVTVTVVVPFTIEPDLNDGMFISSFTADRTEARRGENVTFTAVISDNIDLIRIVCAVDGEQFVSYNISKTSDDVTCVSNSDGTETLTFTLAMTYKNTANLTETDLFTVYYYNENLGWVDGGTDGVSVNVTKYDTSAEVHEAGGKAVEPFSVLSVTADPGRKLAFTTITVVTTSDVTKVRITVDGASTTYAQGSSNLVYTDNGDGTATWLISYRFKSAGKKDVTAEARNYSWENCSTATTQTVIYKNAAELETALAD
ncbi:MAG: InlB B-repeat-containing protein [Clostridia bacterium]|nr:InlB B-repeat-containing protein [Clostridia bacterium]